MPKKLTEKQILEKVFEAHGSLVKIDLNTYTGYDEKSRFIDVDFGEWWASLHNVSGKRSSHPKRGNEKRKQTCIERYGVNSICELDGIKKKKEETCIKNYGVSNPQKSKTIRKKTQETNLIKYGVKVPIQNKEVALKNARAQNNSFVLFHWKTNEELVCIGSYEKKVIEHLNKAQIDFDFQIPFDMPDGRKYFIDLYLKDQNLWVEVKGWFRGDGKEKWDWFHEAYPNSELWNEQYLKSKGIL